MIANAETNQVSFREIWNTLKAVDINGKTKEKNGCTYLSWAWAWGVLMDHYPEATYEFTRFEGKDYLGYHDKTASVECTVTICGHARTMWLPVMTGYQNKAKQSPDARDVGDAKMRCLVKCLAMFGLGHYIYAGEDLPRDEKPEPKKPANKPDPPITTATVSACFLASEQITDAGERAFSDKPAFERWVSAVCKGKSLQNLTEAGGKKLHEFLNGNKHADQWDGLYMEAYKKATDTVVERSASA